MKGTPGRSAIEWRGAVLDDEAGGLLEHSPAPAVRVSAMWASRCRYWVEHRGDAAFAPRRWRLEVLSLAVTRATSGCRRDEGRVIGQTGRCPE